MIGDGNFSAPSTEYDHLTPDSDRIGVHVAAWRVLAGLPLARLVDRVAREEAALIGDGARILYTALVGSALEFGYNLRFKFMIEPLLLTYWIVVAVRWRTG
jgi:hypothetical protein